MKLLNEKELKETVMGVLNECVENLEDYERELISEDFVEEYADNVVESLSNDMEKYCRRSDTSIVGNFNDVRLNYERFVHSDEITFDEIVKLTSETPEEKITGLISDFRTWLENWLWETVGTFGVKYNFNDVLASELYELENEE